MICDICKKNEANIHIKKVINGVKQEKNICEQCAKEVEGVSLGTELEITSPFSFQNVLSGIMDYMNQSSHSKVTTDLMCNNCGTTYSDFKERGLLGCSECYSNFKTTLIPVIKRVQGNIEHVGKIPVKAGKEILVQKQLNNLKEEIQKAIALEEYERAAEIRDKIREINKSE